MDDDAFLTGVESVAELAAEHANDVDQAARFPQESVDALRDLGAMSALADGISFPTVARACHILARGCSATAMVFAMHSIEVACLLGHRENWTWLDSYLLDLRRDQRLIASVTSEIGTGGDMARSIAAVDTANDGSCSFTKQAPTVSYGAFADDYLTSLRRDPTAESGDQVLVLTSRDQTTLDQFGTWDPLGMRGTCSPGFTITAQFPAEQVLPAPYTRIGAQTMVPASHLLWSHVWTGIATEAFDRARKSVKAGAVPAGSGRGQRLSELHGELAAVRAQVAEAMERWLREAAEPERPALNTMSATLRHNALKTSASAAVARITAGALQVCGIAGYRNDSPFSVGRLLRDSLSASLMVSNDRLHETNASLLMVVKES